MKDKIINLRASEKEIKQINTLAKRAKMTRSDFIRHSIFNKEIIVLDGLIAFNKELKRIGENLNRLTKLSNMGRIAAMNLVETKIEFSNISDKLTEICASKNNNKYDFEIPSNVIEDKEISPLVEPHNHSPYSRNHNWKFKWKSDRTNRSHR